jgi:hypothetical protein
VSRKQNEEIEKETSLIDNKMPRNSAKLFDFSLMVEFKRGGKWKK